MKSKWLFIFIGGFILAAVIMYYMGISMEIIMLLSGVAIIIIGIVTLKMEMTWRGDSDTAAAKVTGYCVYQSSGGSDGRVTMYTMEVEYTTNDGKKIHAREQSGRSGKKYAEGTDLKVRYSRKDPELFIVEGDNSRIYAMLGVIVMGIIIAALFGYLIKNGIQVEQ